MSQNICVVTILKAIYPFNGMSTKVLNFKTSLNHQSNTSINDFEDPSNIHSPSTSNSFPSTTPRKDNHTCIKYPIANYLTHHRLPESLCILNNQPICSKKIY